MRTQAKQRLLALLIMSLMLVGTVAHAQLTGVSMSLETEKDGQAFIGLGGVIQPGTWTPVRVMLTNNGAENVEVHCRWLLSDEDGDELVSERTNITLQPQRPLGVWLYATPPMSTRSGQAWVFQAVDTESGELLNQIRYQLGDKKVIDPSINLIGICGFEGIGLTPWERHSTHHEEIKLVRGLSLETLPDRWYGLDSISSLVWVPSGGQPTDSKMSDASKRALREWVYRGGHLVLVLPYVGEQWTGADSGLADLLAPITSDRIKQTRATAPVSVFGVLRSTEPVGMNYFDLDGTEGYTVLAEVNIAKRPANLPAGVSPPPPDLKPMIVGKRFGFGQITLVGADLSKGVTEIKREGEAASEKVPGILAAVDSFRLHRVWTRIFNWRASKTGELLPSTEFTNSQTRNQYWEAQDASDKAELGNWMSQRVAREGSTGAAIGLAFVLFIVYILFSAATFPNFLKPKGWQRHSWMLFVGIVALFSLVAWGGAWLMRPINTSVAHFTVLDIDGRSNRVHARSWQSLLIPSFATADVQVNSESEGLARMEVVNLLSSPGNDLLPDSPGYPDRRSYVFNAEQPSQLGVPMRSTTKSMRVDFLGQITGQQDGLAKPWTMPKASVRINNGIPVGTIEHEFPEALQDVTIIYCPGGAQYPALGTQRSANRPIVHIYRDPANQNKPIWQPNTPLALPNSSAAYSPLWVRPSLSSKTRNWRREGYLGTAIADRGYGDGSGNDNNVVRDMPLVSFFGAIPPPDYEAKSGVMNYATQIYSRSLVRDLDLTHLITGRRLIIIGHLRNSPSPVPLTIEGDTVPSEGWTVVRWIYDL